jgi:hypothetical protein
MRSSPQRRRYSNDSTQPQQQEHYCQSSSKREMKSSLLNMEDDQEQNNWMLFRNMMDDDGDYQKLSKRNNRNQNQVVDTIVNAATICNSLVSEYCGLCTFYLDRQVQYELITSASVLPLSSFDFDQKEGRLGSQGQQKASCGDVTEVAMMLFDEESVVASVSSR